MIATACLLIIGCSLVFLLGFALTGKLASAVQDRARLRELETRMVGFYPFLTGDEFDRRAAEQADPAVTEVTTQKVA